MQADHWNQSIALRALSDEAAVEILDFLQRLLLLNVSKVGRLTQTTESCASMCVMAHVYWIWEKARLLLNLLQQKNLLLLWKQSAQQ